MKSVSIDALDDWASALFWCVLATVYGLCLLA